MSDSFRTRGIGVVADTTEAAEFYIRGYQVSDESLAAIVRSITQVMHSEYDRHVGNVIIREIEGYDVVYIAGRDGDQVVMTVGMVIPPDEDDPTETLLKRLGVMAIFRGATGV